MWLSALVTLKITAAIACYISLMIQNKSKSNYFSQIEKEKETSIRSIITFLSMICILCISVFLVDFWEVFWMPFYL